ncbi:SAM-dependent methyltransferase [Marmoricola sp. URHA0025 HA25]
MSPRTQPRQQAGSVRCPACESTHTTVGPKSHTQFQIVARCRSCGACWLADAPRLPATLSVDEVPENYVDTWVDNKRETVGTHEWKRQLEWLGSELQGVERPRLYDVGAGDGEFLALARDEFGFEVGGNDILEGAILTAKRRYAVDLDLGDLSTLTGTREVDAVTMWCVLAHTDHGDAMVGDVASLLKPGGVLFLQTPHRTLADRVLIGAKSVTGGRWSRLSDRRLAIHHRILHTRRSVTALLERHGFVDVQVQPQARYSLSSEAYLASLRTPQWALPPAAKAMDLAVRGPLAPRIVLDVRARKRS